MKYDTRQGNITQTWVTIESCRTSWPAESFSNNCNDTSLFGTACKAGSAWCDTNVNPHHEQASIVQPALHQPSSINGWNTGMQIRFASWVVLLLCEMKLQDVSLKCHVDHILPAV